MHRVRLAPIDAGELRRLPTASSIGALMRSLASTPPAPADQDGADMIVAPNAPIALQATLHDGAARTIQHIVFGYRSLRQRVDRVADALIQELRHGRPVDTAVGRLASFAPELKLPIAWSPLPLFGGLLAGVRSQWQRVSLLAVAAYLLDDGSESLVRRNDADLTPARPRMATVRKYTLSTAGWRSVAKY